jgi:hypothetical protein
VLLAGVVGPDLGVGHRVGVEPRGVEVVAVAAGLVFERDQVAQQAHGQLRGGQRHGLVSLRDEVGRLGFHSPSRGRAVAADWVRILKSDMSGLSV